MTAGNLRRRGKRRPAARTDCGNSRRGSSWPALPVRSDVFAADHPRKDNQSNADYVESAWRDRCVEHRDSKRTPARRLGEYRPKGFPDQAVKKADHAGVAGQRHEQDPKRTSQVRAELSVGLMPLRLNFVLAGGLCRGSSTNWPKGCTPLNCQS